MNGIAMKNNLRFLAHGTMTLYGALSRDISARTLETQFPPKIHVLNLLVNDICNSRCQMCNIWKQKKDTEFTPERLELILADRLFNDLAYVGVSGGEPTLRPDLADIFRVLTRKQPRLQGTSIITNAIQADSVISRILAIAQICGEAGVPFSAMVSLDGIGQVHDQVRGRQGNYASALEVIKYLRDRTKIRVSVGCTITKDNVWHVDEVLDFCRQEGVYGRFRIAEFIRRLYNDDRSEYIRNFNREERIHLGLFFAKLELTYEQSRSVKATYRSIRQMLLDDAPRSSGCPYRTVAITLNSRGQLLYCAPKSPVLGSALSESAESLYRHNIARRKKIITQYCSGCIHDYDAPETTADVLSRFRQYYWNRQLSLTRSLVQAKKSLPRLKRSPVAFENMREVLIVGWYGTETAGDKAILGELIHQLRIKNAGVKITLASLYPYYSRLTVDELALDGVRIIPTYSHEFWQASKRADRVIMGGGPLMDIEELGTILWSFILAKQSRHITQIAGCGIGPIGEDPRYAEAIQHILRFSDVIELRDSASAVFARQWTGRDDITMTGDPAEQFVRRWKDEHTTTEQSAPYLNLFLREWPEEYRGALSLSEFSELKVQFESELGQWIRQMCEDLQVQPRFLAMHHFIVGNDDREFNRRFATKYLCGLDPVVDMNPLTVSQILSFMQTATLNICMRYHSVLFAKTLGVPLVAIDYTMGGKVARFIEDCEEPAPIMSVAAIARGEWHRLLKTGYNWAAL